MQLSQAGIFTLPVTTNTLYQNNNSILYIYSTSSNIKGWIGTPSNMILIDNTSLTPSTSTQTIIVPPLDYYKFNYTSASFIGETIPNNNTYPKNQVIFYPSYQSPNNEQIISLFFFCSGVAFFLLGYIKYLRKRMLILLLFRLLAAFMFFVSLSIIAITSQSSQNTIITTQSATYYLNQTSQTATSAPLLSILFYVNILLVAGVIGITIIEMVIFLDYFK